MLSGRTSCQIMDQIRHKTGNSLEFSFVVSMLLLIFYVPTVTKYSYHEIGSVQLYTKHKGGLVSVVWDYVVSAHGAATT